MIDADALEQKLDAMQAELERLKLGMVGKTFLGRVREVIKAQPTVNEWRPIETCPEEDVDVLFVEWEADGPFYCVGSKWRGSFFISVDAPVTPKPTHWMPLPEPPAQESK